MAASLSDLQVMAVSGSTDALIQAGTAGEIQRAPSMGAWGDRSHKVKPLRLYAISDDGQTAVGEQGLVFHKDGSDWLAIPSPASTYLYAVVPGTGGQVICAGDASTVLTLNTSQPMGAVTSQALPITADIRALARDMNNALRC